LLRAMQQRLRMPTRTQRAGCTAAVTVPSSQRRRTDASDD